MKFSTLIQKIDESKQPGASSVCFARKGRSDCMWFDAPGILCRYSEASKSYEQRFVSLSLEDQTATDWQIIKRS